MDHDMEQSLQEIDLNPDAGEADELLDIDGNYLLMAAARVADANGCSERTRACMEEVARQVEMTPDCDRVPLMATVALCLMWSVSRAIEGGD